MYLIALKMLLGDGTRYAALVLGLAFSTMLIVQQGSVFTGIIRRTAVQIESVPQADIWVMHPDTRNFDERKPIEDNVPNLVRNVNGVAWADRLFVGNGSAKFPGGGFAAVLILPPDAQPT